MLLLVGQHEKKSHKSPCSPKKYNALNSPLYQKVLPVLEVQRKKTHDEMWSGVAEALQQPGGLQV